ncbi:MAG: hypothetical protein A2268_00440 [Candidatus Raymondbacteria bacterium RifOxyA12_full_50_37]|uniref:Secretion system C-terminal sorting domain-containing protein n=1 Tax=Candidatus Raymondbacteria bacterium RIFOXYD12_FULL_49_13 TaxID=1817890 RepID=A0A1F7F3A0_UNCRA|nr:MAG: hypothetical protein A2268_00440 [Candidatus Raymondbacteria bacterium RifOxyA12_full_50_37]OGJ92784.1 MAG: hypothetical protein A2248_04490 [Candidatus Raymondbacteria bacterium RIFOXYA2_FULL_49_16]OGK00986.1 MAG: hypothetical protein A2519_17150 [Candidatus Raymondbacteria bacterium RIFOXYD12_FULL_49_13]OGK02450.1 MAG: hypothetical protein A2487_20735 [Candidatus Raymondbacteria bacterium RifOxyC12_full_50_8]OGP44560.1 MAG: hypothetical protein A2324_10285 [Candidatus Raymondbacteria 
MGVLLFLLVSLSYPDVVWPPDTCNCAQWHTENVLSHPGCPGNTIVWVSHNGNGDTISFATFLNVVGSYDNRTYIIKASPEPYIVGCRQVTIGPNSTTGARTCLTIRGETGNRDDVVLAGADPAIDSDFWKSTEYGGSSSCGIYQTFQFYNVEHVVVADLSMINFPGKMLKVDGRVGWYPKDIRFHNLYLRDCGSQMIKVGGQPISSMDGILECSKLEYAYGLFEENVYETQGIDVHRGNNWIIRDNYFLNIRNSKRTKLFGHSGGILLWDSSFNVRVERNLLVNNNKPIRLAIEGFGGDSMWVVNNVIVSDDPDTNYLYHYAIEFGDSLRTGGAYHNTIWNPVQSEPAAFGTLELDAQDSVVVLPYHNSLPIENNLYLSGGLTSCPSFLNNIQAQDSGWFINAAAYDFNLSQNHTVARLEQVLDDILGKLRPASTSAGAYEFAPLSGTHTMRHGETGLLDMNITPNPFNPHTIVTISGIAPWEKCELVIYGIAGNIVERLLASGSRFGEGIVWNANSLPSGMYIAKVAAGSQKLIKRAILLK